MEDEIDSKLKESGMTRSKFNQHFVKLLHEALDEYAKTGRGKQ